MAYYLAIDQGTNSSRAIVFDDQGRAVNSYSQSVGIQRSDTHRVEQDAQEILDSVRAVITGCVAGLSSSQRNDIVACGLCTQRSTVVQMNQQGVAISPALSWQDTRGAEWLETLSAYEQQIQSISGLPLSPHYGASKMRWLDLHPGEISQSNEQKPLLTPLAGYLIFNLTGRKLFCVDHCNAQRTQLMNLATRQWSARLLKLFQLGNIELPECLPVCHDYGELLDTGIHLQAVSGDQNSTAYGSGELSDDEALINFGSGAFVLRAEHKLIQSKVQLNSIGYSENKQVTWLKEGTINGCGTALSWASEQWDLGDLKKNLPEWLDPQSPEVVKQPGVFINSVGGIGSPWWNSDVKAEFIELEEDSKGARAVGVLESILFLVMDNLVLMQKQQAITKLRVSGGLSQLDGLCQKLANLSRLEVSRLHNPEATARGIAWLAAGRPANWEQFPADRFCPQRDPGLTKRYATFTKELAKRTGTK